MHRLGVLGWPVAHSRSPAMHNAALQALGMEDWRYQALPVPRELFAETTRALGQAGFVGANVTIPHKQAALALAEQASVAAKAIGAANTLTFSSDGTIAAENTDAPGLIVALSSSSVSLPARARLFWGRAAARGRRSGRYGRPARARCRCGTARPSAPPRWRGSWARAP